MFLNHANSQNTHFSTPVNELEKCVVVEKKEKCGKKICFVCRKKVGLIGITCRCGELFCGLHRYAEEHNCTFDYKNENIKMLNSALDTKGISSKLEKI